MAAAAGKLKIGDVGSYTDLAARPNPSNYMFAAIPRLVSVLIAAEKKSGHPLTEPEVIAIRDKAGYMVLPDKGELLRQDRDYEDIDPKNCWSEWQHARAKLFQNSH